MTNRAPNWFEQKYIAGAIHVLQTDGYLTQGMAMPATSQKGNTVTWKIAGKGEATEMADGFSEVNVLNADRSTVSATMKDYEANEVIKVTDVEKMSEAEQQVAQQTCGYAMGRKFDKILIGAFDAEAGNIPNIGNGTANIDLPDLLQGQSEILAQGVIGELQMFVALPFKQMAALMLRKGFASADYVTDNPLMQRIGARRYLNMLIVPFPDDYFAVPATNQFDGYMWARSGVGFATNTDEKGKIAAATRIDYLPMFKHWLAANTMTACSKVILPGAIRRLRFATNQALTAGL